MEHQKILNSLNEVNNSKFVIRKCNSHDNSRANYDVGNEIIYNTEVLNQIFVITTMLKF